LKQTPLYEKHLALGAKMVDFGGWMMPIHYSKGIVHEHLVVRNSIGIFDVSHMGRVTIEGPEAAQFLEFICTNKIANRKHNTATYTVMCHSDGGAVDDLLIYRIDENRFFAIVNAGNRDKDLQHFKKHAEGFDVVIRDLFSEEGILAIQGPEVQALAGDLKPMTFAFRDDTIVSRTGYTGAGGVEIYAPKNKLLELWDEFIDKGIEPIGLGARNTLRLEKGYCLYSHELNDDIMPHETIASWVVKLDKENFVGKDAMQALTNKRYQYGIVLTQPGIARDGYKVFKNNDPIGYITSGTHSPSLNKSIAIIMVSKPLEENEEIDVLIRNKPVKAEVKKLPFV
jgi:aminomethyltransferase